MTVLKDFALPDLGEGLTESELVAWHVSVGDTVKLNQIIADVETAKALVELPSPWSGVVSRLYVEPGVTVNVGEPIVAFEVEGDPDSDAPLEAPAGASASDVPIASAPSPDESEVPAREADIPEPNLVGYGARAEATTRPQRRARPGLGVLTSSSDAVTSVASATAPPASTARASATAAATAPAASAAPAIASSAIATAERPRATPPVRRRAHELGVDLASVVGTGERGLVTRHDVEEFRSHGATTGGIPEERAGAGRRTERETRIPIRGVRKRTAEAMVRSAFTAPQATAFLTVDVTETTALLDRIRADRAFEGVRVTMLAVVAKAVCIAVARTPSVNSHWDADANEIVEFGYIDLGIAAATPRGLLVPTIPDADQLTLLQIASALTELVATARSGHTPPERLVGGTISISNVGVFGVDGGTPILNPGEAAILALGAVRRQPWEHHGAIALRDVVTLSVSFDHRLLDGEQASHFVTDVGRILSDPAVVMTMV